MSRSNRIYGLDIYRALAILSVIFGHGNLLLHKVLPGFPWFPIPDGVELFFVLSGFLIGQIVLKDFNAKMKISDLIFFWKRRWYRTLPNYYLALLLNFLLAYFSLNTNNIERFSWKFLLFMQNLWEPFMGFFWESWSLSVEEWFYIIFPLLTFLILIYSKYSKKNVFLISILTLIILPLIYKVYLGVSTNVDGFWWDITFRKMVITRLDTIIYGVAMAFIKHYYLNIWSKFKYIMFLVGMILLVFNLNIERPPNSFYSKTFFFVINSIGASLLLPIFDSIKTGSGILYRFFTWISKISYSMYILHFAIILQVILKLAPLEKPVIIILYYGFYWFITLTLSSLVYTYFELPFIKLRPKKNSK